VQTPPSDGTSLPGCSFTKQLFHDHHVAPLAVELAVAAVGADDAEADALVQADAGCVLAENPRTEFPEAAALVFLDQRFERRAAGAEPARRALDIDRMLGDAGVGPPRAIRARSGPGDDASLAFDNDGRILLALLAQQLRHLLGRSRVGFEGRDGVLDSLVVDPHDIGRIAGVRALESPMRSDPDTARSRSPRFPSAPRRSLR